MAFSPPAALPARVSRAEPSTALSDDDDDDANDRQIARLDRQLAQAQGRANMLSARKRVPLETIAFVKSKGVVLTSDVASHFKITQPAAQQRLARLAGLGKLDHCGPAQWKARA